MKLRRTRCAGARGLAASLTASLTVGLAMWIAPGTARAGAWVQPRDAYYLKVSASVLSTTKELDFNGDEVDILSGDTLLTNTSYRDISVSLYLEYGITDRLTGVATLPFKVLRSARTEISDLPGLTRDVEAVNGGFGDLSLGLRYPLMVKPMPVSVQGAIKLPLGYDKRPDNGGPPLGSSRVDVEGFLLGGASLYPFPGYVTGGVGYRLKSGDLDDEFLFALEAGATWKRMMFRLGVDGLYSTAEPPDLSRSEDGRVSSAVVITNQDILKLTPAVGLAFNDEVSLVAEAFHVIDGKNTVAGTTWSLGIAYTQ